MNYTGKKKAESLLVTKITPRKKKPILSIQILKKKKKKRWDRSQHYQEVCRTQGDSLRRALLVGEKGMNEQEGRGAFGRLSAEEEKKQDSFMTKENNSIGRQGNFHPPML